MSPCVENYYCIKGIIFGRQDVNVLRHFKTKLSFSLEKVNLSSKFNCARYKLACSKTKQAITGLN